MKISVKLIENENEIIANCPELDINCYGSSKKEAVRRIKSVIHFYIESARELGLDVENLKEIAVEGDRKVNLEEATFSSSTDIIN
jgi:predicted RNase H-like HicB family nuclease